MVDQPHGSHGKTNKSALSPTCAIIPCDDSCDVRETKRQPWRETVLASLEQRHTAHRRCELLQTPSCAIKICVCTLKNCFASSLSDMTMVWMKNTSLSIELQILSKPTVANDCDVPCEPNTNGFSVGLACIVDQRDTRNLNQMHHFMWCRSNPKERRRNWTCLPPPPTCMACNARNCVMRSTRSVLPPCEISRNLRLRVNPLHQCGDPLPSENGILFRCTRSRLPLWASMCAFSNMSCCCLTFFHRRFFRLCQTS